MILTASVILVFVDIFVFVVRRRDLNVVCLTRFRPDSCSSAWRFRVDGGFLK
jgi:hypothetical protein